MDKKIKQATTQKTAKHNNRVLMKNVEKVEAIATVLERVQKLNTTNANTEDDTEEIVRQVPN